MSRAPSSGSTTSTHPELTNEIKAQSQLAWTGQISAEEFLAKADAKRDELLGHRWQAPVERAGSTDGAGRRADFAARRSGGSPCAGVRPDRLRLADPGISARGDRHLVPGDADVYHSFTDWNGAVDLGGVGELPTHLAAAQQPHLRLRSAGDPAHQLVVTVLLFEEVPGWRFSAPSTTADHPLGGGCRHPDADHVHLAGGGERRPRPGRVGAVAA